MPTATSPTPFISKYGPGQFNGMTNHRSPFAYRHSEVKIARDFPVEMSNEIHSPEHVPKTLTYTNAFQPKLGDIRDKVRRNNVFHTEFNDKYD